MTYAFYKTHHLIRWLLTVSKVKSITIRVENRVEGRQIGKQACRPARGGAESFTCDP